MTDGLAKGLTDYGDPEFSLFLRRAFVKSLGYTDDALSRPIVGIADTASAYNACHANVPDMVEALKRGVLLAGGLPMPFPTISVHEAMSQPTSMFLRNLMAMDTEEMVRAQPMDAVVMIGGCDKTVPAQMMAAASGAVPAVSLVTGPMLVGHHRGEVLGACTDCRRFWAKFRAGEMTRDEIDALNSRLAPTAGTCMVMGTASTMACIVEALGLALPGSAAIPATHADRLRCAEESGRVAVEAALASRGGARGRLPADILTPSAFRNAMVVLQAIGGSTNGLIHLAAIAGRVGQRIDLQEFDRIGREVPVLIDLKPSGEHYMEHFHHAGGMPRLMRELGGLIDRSAPTITGATIGDAIDAAEDVPGQTVIRGWDKPIYPVGGMAVLHGNLAPGGAVIKHSAASPELLKHTGRAVVFDGVVDMAARIDRDDLDVTADDVLVLRYAGPRGAPGMPEAGYLPIPKKLARQGVKDIVRISDARMSGTAFGTIVLHIVPEAETGGPLALISDGDPISLDVEARTIRLEIDDAELERRRRALTSRPPHPDSDRGYLNLFLRSVLQADEGCDFDFLVPGRATSPSPASPPQSGEAKP